MPLLQGMPGGRTIGLAFELVALFAANGAGFAKSRDIYGEVTYIKTQAGLSNADALVLSGNPAVTLSDQKYEAEYASLSGKTVAGQPQVGSDHKGYSGTGFVNGMEAEQAAVTFYAKTANPGDYEVTLRCSNGANAAKTLSAYVNGTYCGQALAYGIDSGSGTNKPESPVEGDKRAYFYHAAAYEQSIHQGLNVENGSYRVEAFVKVVNTSPGVGRMEITNYGGNAVYVDMPKAGSGWHKIEAGNVLVTNGTIDIGFYCSSGGGTTVHIDDVRLYRN